MDTDNVVAANRDKAIVNVVDHVAAIIDYTLSEYPFLNDSK